MAFFEESDEILNNIIGEKILRNQNLCKLLSCYAKDGDSKTYNPLKEPDIEDTSNLLMKYLYPLPKSPDLQTEQTGYMTVVLSGSDKNFNDYNSGYRRVYLIFDIIIHLNQWIIEDSYRVYKIAEEIDKMLNNKNTDLPIFGKSSYIGFKQRDYTHSFYGIQLIYEFIVNSNIECMPMPQNINSKEERPIFISNVLGRENG